MFFNDILEAIQQDIWPEVASQTEDGLLNRRKNALGFGGYRGRFAIQHRTQP